MGSSKGQQQGDWRTNEIKCINY